MEVFVILSLMLVVTTCVSGSDSIQARGFDEGPWSSNQQPEILIVKEKGGSQTAPSSGKMKDLTPLLCLLAPLLLAAIMLPSKMTMMMNGMMGTTSNLMMPMPGMMMPGMMMPGPIPPLMAYPLTAMLSSGVGSNNKPLSLPLFKNFIESKKFSEDASNHLDVKDNNSYPPDGLKNGLVLDIFERSKENKKNEWYVADKQLTPVPFEPKQTKNSKKNKKNKGETENEVWSSRVWPTDESKTSLADEILNLFDEVWNAL